MQEKIKEILDQIETVIVGKNEVMERILMAILAGGHVLMEDVPGVGKTTTAMTFARVLGWKRAACSSPPIPCRRTSSAFLSTIRTPESWSISPAQS